MKDSFSNYRYFQNKDGFWSVQRKCSLLGFSWWRTIFTATSFGYNEAMTIGAVKREVDGNNRPKWKPEYKTVNEEMFKF